MTAARFALVGPPSPSLDLIDRLATPEAIRTPLHLTKRAEFFLEEMLGAGPSGITTIDYPGVRVGDAIHKLRKAGIRIETQYEQHGGEFAGNHGRYILRSRVERVATQSAALSETAEQPRAGA